MHNCFNPKEDLVFMKYICMCEHQEAGRQLPQETKGRVKPLPLMSLLAQQDQTSRRRSPAYGGQTMRNSPKKGYDGDGFR